MRPREQDPVGLKRDEEISEEIGLGRVDFVDVGRGVHLDLHTSFDAFQRGEKGGRRGGRQ